MWAQLRQLLCLRATFQRCGERTYPQTYLKRGCEASEGESIPSSSSLGGTSVETSGFYNDTSVEKHRN